MINAPAHHEAIRKGSQAWPEARQKSPQELRFRAANGEWRVAFAFDPKRRAILLAAGDKSGGSVRRFYRRLLAKADDRFDAHLARLKKAGK